MKVRKCSSLAPPRNKFYKTQLAWQGVKLSRLISIFTSKNVWKFLIKIQLTKSDPKIIRGVRPGSCQLGLTCNLFCKRHNIFFVIPKIKKMSGNSHNVGLNMNHKIVAIKNSEVTKCKDPS